MRKFLRYLFQYAILAGVAFFVYQTAFKRDTPPVHDRDHWTQRDGFVALSYGGLSIEEKSGPLITKNQLREQLEALAKAGFRTITTEDVAAFYHQGKPLPEKPLYLMFEGGRKDSVLFSQPVLVRLGFNAALYLYGDKLTGWNRFFVRQGELRKVADNPFWDVDSMGYQSGPINETPQGAYAYPLTQRLAAAPGRPAETEEAFAARVARDYREAFASIEADTGKPPLGYVFMPANSLGVSLPEAIATPNVQSLARYFPVAFTRVGESYNPREADPRRLTRLQVDPSWSADRLLLEIESRLPRAAFLDFSTSVRQGLWQIATGVITVSGQHLTLQSPGDKDGFARLRGSEGFDNFVCQVTVTPAPDGAALLYLRYRDSGSFVRLQITPDQILVREKNGHALNTIFQYTLPLDHTGPVALDCCVKSNRLLLRVNGRNVGPYPIPLAAETSRGSFALGSLGEHGAHQATFTDLRLSTFPPRWVQSDTVANVPLEQARTLTGMVLPATSLTTNPIGDAAALVTVAANGVTAFLDMPGADAAKIEKTAAFVTAAPASLVFAKLLRGFVLSLEDFPDTDALARLENWLHEKGYAVALRVSAATRPRLLESGGKLHPDWLLFDMPPLDSAQDMTVLGNRFDMGRMLFRAPDTAGSGTVYYDVKG